MMTNSKNAREQAEEEKVLEELLRKQSESSVSKQAAP